jgi:hypothetical protein
VIASSFPRPNLRPDSLAHELRVQAAVLALLTGEALISEGLVGQRTARYVSHYVWLCRESAERMRGNG